MEFTKTLLAFGLAAAASASAAQYEAEDGTLTKDAAVASNTEASGGKYVKMNGGDITFPAVTVEKAGQYSVVVHYMNNYGGDKINYVGVGSTTSQVSFPVTDKGKFVDVETVLTLAAGANTIAITNSWGWIDVDYIEVKEFEAKAFTLCNAPVTKNATPSAIKLYNFLVNNFGKKTISGVMTGNMDAYTIGDATQHEDVQAVYKAGGKYPALIGADLMNATGANKDEGWFQQYTEKAIDIAKTTWKKGGIPAFTWHWRPGDEVEFYVKGAHDTYTEFDFSEAFIKGSTTWDTTSAAYKAIVGDIDHVSQIFLDLQKEGVAAIFRPLHESGGNWFWWSINTGKQFIALYQLLYERMVFKNGVNNLIWDFNPQDASKLSWTPGETYYDVLSVDIYNKANDHQSNSAAFIDFANKGGTNKIIALSENGPIPDVDNMYAENAPWSWWMPWYESWSAGFVSQTAESVWKKNLADERIITLDEMPGWDNYNEAASATKACPTSTENAKYGAGEATPEDYKNLMMAVTYTALNDSGANIELKKVPNLTGATTVSLKITNNGSGGADNGIWVGLAFVRNGMKDDAWTWEMSTSTGCWINDGASATCEFDITKYEDDDKVEHPIDLDNLFSVTLMVAAVGFEGTVIFDELVADNGKVISAFDKKTELFTAADQSKGHIAKIELVDETGAPAAIKPVVAKASASAKLGVSGKTVSLTTTKAGMVAVEVFGMNGKRVATLYKGNLAAGTSAFSLADMPKGRYIVRVKGAGIAATQPVLIK
ncbi:Por secretion system C-terminal sorting domain-containing protein [Fibrobacter sp. UWOV1]|uniref:glycosyl hydrolase n=1 Tax=Fibrobacter sp. UWOV1 TaxID=1896215 RepID=UPI0009172F28|nr:glycosyl hydrolase [Fibrobacter sp. UWOV1]SHK51824.1 Por secretion system C-terminal sorting domain-containing protein [Fibrobacter sp. UWOV1]